MVMIQPLCAVFCALQVVATVQASPNVIRATVLEETIRPIKPCQQVTALIDVVVEKPIATSGWLTLVENASTSVKINDRVYRNRLGARSRLNDAARFELASDVTNQSDSARIAVEFFIDFEDRTCLFLRPEFVRAEFTIGELSVTVPLSILAPSLGEAGIIEKIKEPNLLAFLASPDEMDQVTDELVREIESMAQIESSYKPQLSRALGLAKLKVPRDSLHASDDAARRERLEEIRGLLCSSLNESEFRSKTDALAALNCGIVLGLLSEFEPDTTAKQTLQNEQIRVWRRVVDSYYTEARATARKLLNVNEKTEK